jgi:hypothetical protein
LFDQQNLTMKNHLPIIKKVILAILFAANPFFSNAQTLL